MIYASAFLAIAVFALGLWLFGVVPAAAKAMSTSREAASTMRDKTLSDDDTEIRLRRASIALAVNFASITARTAATLGASLVPLLAFDLAGLSPLSEVTDWLETWEAILLASAAMTLGFLVLRRRRTRNDAT